MNILGLDLGKRSDFAALAFIERVDMPLEPVAEPISKVRCLVTKRFIEEENPGGMKESPCSCKNCQQYLATIRLKEGGHALVDLKPIENPWDKKPQGGDLTSKLNPYRAGEVAFDDGMTPAEPTDKPKDFVRNYKGRALRQFPLGTDYIDIVKYVKRLCQHPIIVEGKSVLVVDWGGVGEPVVEMFQRARLGIRIVPILITGGKAVTEEPKGFHVPKMELVGLLTVMLETGRLGFAAGIPEVELLLQELREFKIRITKAANETAGAEGQAHDDLVMAVALALFFGERGMQRLRVW